MLIALVGNQNCGKTTLFNALTGSNQHVGNFPGVTVDSKIGTIKNQKSEMQVVDLPGIYSLSPYSNEEIVTRDFILKNKPDIILNILDATNLERNLYLTLQLAELNIPMVLALNMMDEVKSSGNSIDLNKLEEELGIEVCAISASKNEGIHELIQHIERIADEHILPKKDDICSSDSPIHRAIHAMMNLIEDHAQKLQYPLRYVATRLIEGDTILEKEIKLSENELDMLGHIVKEMETDAMMDREAAMAAMRYKYIDAVASKTIKRINPYTKEQILTNKIDKILTNKYLAFPIFIIIMALVFYLTFGLIGYYLSEWLGMGIEALTELVRKLMIDGKMNNVVISLLCDGIMGGVGSVLSFIPTIVTLFFFLSLLEDSGYMARIAFIMDKPLRKLGLSGRSFVPMLIGFGCSVPAIMASRTLTSERDKKLTIMLTPYMSCSAKLPVFTVLTAAFFGKTSVLVMIGLYLIGIVMAILIASISKLISKGKPTPFMMELPTYRLPGTKTTLLLMWDKAKDFIKKAFTIIFVATIIIWFLQTFDFHFNVVGSEDSILATLAKFITPIFKPIGVDNWRVTSAVITGLSAKESIVSTLDLLLKGQNISDIMSPLQGFSLLVFILLYMPCVATFATMKRELKSTWLAVSYMALETLVAYITATIIYQLGSHLSFGVWDIIIIIAIIIAFIVALYFAIRFKGCSSSACENCAHHQHCQKEKRNSTKKNEELN